MCAHVSVRILTTPQNTGHPPAIAPCDRDDWLGCGQTSRTEGASAVSVTLEDLLDKIWFGAQNTVEAEDARYIIDLLARIVTVSLETMKIVHALPPLSFIPTQSPPGA